MNDDSSSSDDDGPRHLTTGTSRHRGGWQGDEMEMEHQRSQFNNPNNNNNNAPTAVDLNQFRNTKVGEGYQARHVVRQRTAASSSSPAAATEPQPSKKKKKDISPSSSSRQTPTVSTQSQSDVLDLQMLLRNDGLRTFIKEINDILSSPSS
jgi:hypothetical protein